MVTGLEALTASAKAVGAVGSLAKSSSFITRHFRRARHRLKHGYLRVPVFGAGGVGKSTGAKIIAGDPAHSASTEYNESLWTETLSLDGDVPGELIVAPGQIARVAAHWPQSFKLLSAGRALGLINVVSYGYHALELASFKHSDIYEDGMSEDDFVREYAGRRRQVELELLNTVIGGLSATTTKLWMATIINKQDLWMTSEQQVLSHYRDGEYASLIEQFSARLGGRLFQHEYVPVSFVISNLRTASGEVLAESIQGYDIATQRRSLGELSRRLGELIER